MTWRIGQYQATEPAIPSATVLNGTVYKGSTICYPNRWGSSLDMRIATVLEVADKPHAWKSGVTVQVLKVKVTKTSDPYFSTAPYTATIGVLDRVVKLSD